MSIIHENLYRNDNLALINFLEYSGSLISEIIGSYNIDKIIDRKIDIDEEIYFDIETAIPCGLIINEVITNSIKYAFNDSNEGNLILNFHRSKVNGTTKYVMEVGDDGSGIPESIDINKTKTLGIHLIRILVRQLKGEVELFRENGTLYKITFFRWLINLKSSVKYIIYISFLMSSFI